MTDTVLGQTSAWSQSYSYDGFGNLTAKSTNGTPLTYGVSQATNQLTGGTFFYDLNGNLVSDRLFGV